MLFCTISMHLTNCKFSHLLETYKITTIVLQHGMRRRLNTLSIIQWSYVTSINITNYSVLFQGPNISALEKEIGPDRFPPNERYFGLVNVSNWTISFLVNVLIKSQIIVFHR